MEDVMFYGRGQGMTTEWLESYCLAHWQEMMIRQCIQDGKYIIFENSLNIDSRIKRSEYQRRNYIARALGMKSDTILEFFDNTQG